MAERCVALLVAAACLLGAAAMAQPASWPAAATNPRPAAGDLVLPLPCGGAIAFRPVPVPAPNALLADREITLGQPDAETGYTEFLRRSFLAGAFPGPRPNEPARFYIGKYEVTRDQYAAVMAEDGACPGVPSQGGTLPRNEVAWHEAAAFAARLSRYLRRSATDRLPRVDEAVTFVRLPTEDEWEFAARGGAAVDASDFAAATYPMAEGMNAYEFFQGARSADGRVRPIGGLRPNPLGLHDMLGNVAEWALDTYRLNRIGRPHGLAGGQVARGGHYRLAEDDIRSSLRIEHPPVSRTDGELTRLATVGFRVVLTRETVASPAAARRFGEEFQREAAARDSVSEGDDPARIIDLLRRETADQSLRNGLGRLEARLQADARARRDQEAVSLRSRIESAAYLARQLSVGRTQISLWTLMGNTERERLAVLEANEQLLREIVRNLPAGARNRQGGDDLSRLLDDLAARTRSQAAISRQIGSSVSDRFLPLSEARMREMLAQYLSLLVGIGRGADAQRIAQEGLVLVQDFETRQVGFMIEVTRLVLRHLDAVARGGTIDGPAALRDFAALGQPAAAPAPPAGQAPRR
jgi:formylglycine-generating enzyme required for sulfatase activity